ncbi:MAG: hypothetical protein IAE95_05245 [Chitinophagaceae bacterium]|nr:hypothetical protein [Chitinophagaceae bacterium]
MKRIIIAVCALLLGIPSSRGNSDSATRQKEAFIAARAGINDMLSGKDSLCFEKAVFLIESAYQGNVLDYKDFQAVIGFHAANIGYLIDKTSYHGAAYAPTVLEQAQQGYEERKKTTRCLIANQAIYTYMTSPIIQMLTDSNHNYVLYRAPYEYSFNDPFGTKDWSNTQVSHLLQQGRGNCFALAALFKILAERLKTDASLCVAPGHIYITHTNEKGTPFNIEISNGRFPGNGTIGALTYTTDEAIRNDIALRSLDLKQSVALCLVYLAKAYEWKFGTKVEDFMLVCANDALNADNHSLNALLLKAEILEERLLRTNQTKKQRVQSKVFVEYEALIKNIYKLGYREMPIEMKNILVKSWMKDSAASHPTAKQPFAYQTYMGIPVTRNASLSWGLFEEDIQTKPIERFGKTLFNTKTQKIAGFDSGQKTYNGYDFDPVVFALNVDPLAHKFPSESPYIAFGDNPLYFKDQGGAYKYPAKSDQGKTYPVLTKYLAENVQNDIMKSTNIMAGFKQYSGGNLPPAEVQKATTWGAGPTVKIVDNPGSSSGQWMFSQGANGFYDYDNNTIELSTKMANQLEQASPGDRQTALYSIFVTLTHETTHFGDYLDGQRTPGEVGVDFMNDVFYSKTVDADGQKIKVFDPVLDHTNKGDAKQMMQQNISEGKKDLIPTVPQSTK